MRSWGISFNVAKIQFLGFLDVRHFISSWLSAFTDRISRFLSVIICSQGFSRTMNNTCIYLFLSSKKYLFIDKFSRESDVDLLKGARGIVRLGHEPHKLFYALK